MHRVFFAAALRCCWYWRSPARAEDGYDLWLRYRPMETGALAQYRPLASAIVSEGVSPSLDAAQGRN